MHSRSQEVKTKLKVSDFLFYFKPSVDEIRASSLSVAKVLQLQAIVLSLLNLEMNDLRLRLSKIFVSRHIPVLGKIICSLK